MFLKKLSNLSSSYREYIVSQIHFLWQNVFSYFLKFWIIYVFEYFINSIEIFLLTTVDNLVAYIENENCKDFTMEDGEKLI